jgi:hypothetical protein
MPEAPKPPTIAYTGRDFAQARADIIAFIRATRPQDQTDFEDSSLGALIVDLVSFAIDLCSYGQDVTAQEVFLATARRYDSALRFARSVGAPVRGAVSAAVTVKSDTLPSNVVTYGALVAAGQSLTGANGLNYEVTEDTTIVPGSSTMTLVLREGRSFSETFTVTKQPLQEFRVSRGVVEQDSWAVFIGDPTDPTNEWTQSQNVALETSDTRTYEVFFDGQGRLTVRFGDGLAGKIPDQDVTVTYRTTNGATGNTGIGTIRGSMQVSVIGTGTTASVTLQNSTTAATGGQDRETVDELRNSIPAFIRTLDKVITIQDYQQAVLAFTNVGLVFADVPQTSYSGNIVRVHVWDTEQFTFVSTSPGQGITTALAYQRYTQAPSSRSYEVQTYLKPRTMVTVHNVVIRPTIAQVDLDLGQIKYDTSNTAKDVHSGIVSALIDLFEESSGFLVRISDIYSRVLKVPGVIGFTLKSVVFEHIDFTDPNNGTVIEQFRTDTDIAGAVGGPFNPLKDIEVPGASSRNYYDDTFLYNNEILFDSEIDLTAIQAINLRSLIFTLIAG